jgi:hypothetical protein
MAHIKEPKGVDFVIYSRPLTKKEELAISEHIKNYKLKNSTKPAKRLTGRGVKKGTKTFA